MCALNQILFIVLILETTSVTTGFFYPQVVGSVWGLERKKRESVVPTSLSVLYSTSAAAQFAAQRAEIARELREQQAQALYHEHLNSLGNEGSNDVVVGSVRLPSCLCTHMFLYYALTTNFPLCSFTGF